MTFVKIAVYSVLLLQFFSINCEAETSVWKVSDGENHMFIAGSLHALRNSDYPLPDAFQNAFDMSTHLVLEVDLEKIYSPTAKRLSHKLRSYSPPKKLKNIVSKETFDLVESYWIEHSLKMKRLDEYKAHIIAGYMTASLYSTLDVGSAIGMDKYFFEQAKNKNYKISGLETVENTLQYLIPINKGFENEILIETLDSLKFIPNKITLMFKTWRNGDMSAFEEVFFNESTPHLTKEIEDYMTLRNNNWIPRIRELLANKEVEILIVGVAHLTGKNNVLELLTKHGVTIEQL